MFNEFKKTYSYGVWEFLRPRALVESIHACLRVLLDSFSNAEAVNNQLYNSHGNASEGFTASAPVTNIVSASCVAGVGGSSGTSSSLVAGSKEYTGYNFFITGLPANLVLIGKAPDSKLATLNNDFIPYGNGYLFKTNPSFFGTTSNQQGVLTISFYVAGGPVSSKHQPQFKLIYDRTANQLVSSAVSNVTTKGLLCNGISSAVVKASAGVSVARGTGIIDKTWNEGAVLYGETDNDLLRCPSKMATEPVVGITVNPGDTLETSQDIVLYPDNNIWHVLDREYPISTDSFDALFTQKLLDTTAAGITTVDATEYNLSNADYGLLFKYSPVATNLHIIRRLVVPLANPAFKITDNLTRDLADVTGLYVFYTNSSDIPDRYHATAATSEDLLRTHYTNSGCWRIATCDKGNGYIYGVTSNSEIFGNTPDASSKIYGIATIFTGNNYKDDVVYSYCSVPPTAIGSGVEAVVVGVLN